MNIVYNSFNHGSTLWYDENKRRLSAYRPEENIDSPGKYCFRLCYRLTAHPNDILLALLEQPERKRLRRHLPNNLPTRFMV
jgi:hypothetical protein